ncbi:RNA helicase [Aphelenchoides besseyi]|nr:RNA helicase [Aphelenchoides besseyi]
MVSRRFLLNTLKLSCSSRCSLVINAQVFLLNITGCSVSNVRQISLFTSGVYQKTASIKTKLNNNTRSQLLTRQDVLIVLEKFCRQQEIRKMAAEKGIDNKLFMDCYIAYQQHCTTMKDLSEGETRLFKELRRTKSEYERLFAYFLAYSQRLFPHLCHVDELKDIANLQQPQSWYPDARSIHRKVIFHAGPTNSGKTHSALECFMESYSGVYCGPLRLLAAEVFKRTNDRGVPCDLVTGEDRRYVLDNMQRANHLSSTVEMLSMELRLGVAVIDEIQMLRDEQRGWAWTRALLGVASEEVHLCGEASAIKICEKLLDPIGESIEVRNYERKSSLTISTHGLRSLKNVHKGDCIVCFSKRQIKQVADGLNKLQIPFSVIYGSLPPETKLAQAARFNDPNDPTKVLVATDAIGMGLNLNIRRIIFRSLVKPGDGRLIQNHMAVQIAGRAGRYNSPFKNGIVTAMTDDDAAILNDMLQKPIDEIKAAGIAPTYEQLECFAQQLKHFTFVKLLDSFVHFCNCSEEFFLCTTVQNQMRTLALALESIDDNKMPLNVRYTFCTAPLNPEVRTAFLWFKKMAHKFCNGFPLTAQWMKDSISWPLKSPETSSDIKHLEECYDILTAYLWLGYRFPEMFPDMEIVRDMCRTVNKHIDNGLRLIHC